MFYKFIYFLNLKFFVNFLSYMFASILKDISGIFNVCIFLRNYILILCTLRMLDFSLGIFPHKFQDYLEILRSPFWYKMHCVYLVFFRYF